jgi:acyl-CoA dehydrogenase
VEFSISNDTRERLDKLRQLGRKLIRPAGLRADHAGAPLPPDDPFFTAIRSTGFGGTSWREPGTQAPREPSRDSAAPSTAAVTRVLISEEMAYWDRGIGIAIPGPGLGESPVLGMGTAEQQRRFLAPFVNPDKPIWGCFAMTEPSGGSDVSAIKTRAVKDGRHWVLNGAKAFCGNASRSEWIVVFATIDPKMGRAGHRAFVVEKGTPGLCDFHIEKKMGLKAYESTSFFLNDCRVPEENLLGGEAHYASRAGFKGAMQTFNAGRPAIGAMAAGIGRAALDEALDHARRHDLLGDARIADRLERMRRKLKSALMLALRAAWLADQKQPNMLEASMAKAAGAQVGLEATSLAMEIVGEEALRGEHLVEKLFRDIKAMDIVEGTGQIQRLVIARQLVSLPN